MALKATCAALPSEQCASLRPLAALTLQLKGTADRHPQWTQRPTNSGSCAKPDKAAMSAEDHRQRRPYSSGALLTGPRSAPSSPLTTRSLQGIRTAPLSRTTLDGHVEQPQQDVRPVLTAGLPQRPAEHDAKVQSVP